MKKLRVLSFILAFCSPLGLLADGGGYALYVDKIYEMERQGHMNEEEAQEKIFALRLKEAKQVETMKNRARGVASAIRQKKIIKFTNEPIEVSVPKN